MRRCWCVERVPRCTRHRRHHQDNVLALGQVDRDFQKRPVASKAAASTLQSVGGAVLDSEYYHKLLSDFLETRDGRAQLQPMRDSLHVAEDIEDNSETFEALDRVLNTLSQADANLRPGELQKDRERVRALIAYCVSDVVAPSTEHDNPCCRLLRNS